MADTDTDVLGHVTDRVLQVGAVAATTTVITTPEVSVEQVLVHTLVTVKNTSDSPVTAVVHNTVLAPGGREVIRSSALPHLIEPGTAQTASLTQWVRKPAFWSPDSPNLHTARTEVLVGGAVVDRAEETFVIRPEWAPAVAFGCGPTARS